MTRREIINFVESKGGAARRSDIVKFIVEGNGKAYDPVKHRGYYSCAFWKNFGSCSKYGDVWSYLNDHHRYGYLTYPVDSDPRYLRKNADGLWEVTR